VNQPLRHGRVIAGPRPPEPNRRTRLKRKASQILAVSYFSDFERHLNWALGLFLLSAVVYCFAQRVVLINVHEVIPYGARVGTVIYDFSMAYIGAYVFYFLVVRLPLYRDRLNVHRAIQPLASRIVGEAWFLMEDLNIAAGVWVQRPASWANVKEVCNKIGPGSSANPPFITTPTPDKVIDLIEYRVNNAKELHRELLSFSTYLSTELVNLVVELNDSSLINLFEDYVPRFRSRHYYDDDLDFAAVQLYDYLRLADRLDQYHRKYLKNTLKIPDIITEADIDPNVVPLKRLAHEG
jgi:hypothetical protein